MPQTPLMVLQYSTVARSFTTTHEHIAAAANPASISFMTTLTQMMYDTRLTGMGFS